MPKKAMAVVTETMFYVLMAFTEGEKCGIDVAEFVDRTTEGRVRIGPATLYTILGKFEKEKYIAEINADGRKRMYRITERGEEAYENELLRLKQCIADAERRERL